MRSRIRSVAAICRKPHHPAAADGLLCVDELLASETDPATTLALAVSGDQVYTDDVAGPMLRAIHALIARLSLFDEAPQKSAVVGIDAKLYEHWQATAARIYCRL